MNDRRRTIALVDDDPRVLESLGELFESRGYAVRAYPSAKALIDFLATPEAKKVYKAKGMEPG